MTTTLKRRSFLKERTGGRGRCRRLPGHSAVDAGRPVAPDLELSASARYDFRRGADARQVPRRGNRQQVPNPDLPGRRTRRRPAGPRCGADRRRRVRHTPIYFYFGKDPTLAPAPAFRSGQRPPAFRGTSRRARSSSMPSSRIQRDLFACGNSGTQMGGFFRKELHPPPTSNGLKFRIGGLGGWCSRSSASCRNRSPAATSTGPGARHARRGGVRRPL